MKKQTARIPDWILEQYHLGELPEDDQRIMDELLKTDVDLLARLEALKNSDEKILAKYPPRWFMQELEKRIQRRRGFSWFKSLYGNESRFRISWRIVVPVAVSAIVLIILALPGHDRFTQIDTRDGHVSVRTKGLLSHLNVYHVAGYEMQLLGDSSVVSAGDTLQIAYVAIKAEYGVIVSKDGNGTVTLHYPDSSLLPDTLKQSEEMFVHAYVLDDAPGYERFYFITGNTPIDVQEVLKVAKRTNTNNDSMMNLELPQRYRQYAITFWKSKEKR